MEPLGPAVLMTTTPSVEGRKIREYLGVVTGEAVLGAHLFKDIFASIVDIVGGRSASYEQELRKARDVAFREVRQEAMLLGGNAIVGVDLDYEVLGHSGGMLMVSVSGTAVYLD